MIAVIKTGGKQYLVKAGQKIRVEKIAAPEGQSVAFSPVLLLAEDSPAGGGDVKIGKPELKDSSVIGKVLKQGRAKKIDVIKYKRKVRYRRQRGHKQYFSEVLIEKISA